MQEWAANSVLGRSGFLAAFALIFLSEIGDKTFFIAALLAMKVPYPYSLPYPNTIHNLQWR